MSYFFHDIGDIEPYFFQKRNFQCIVVGRLQFRFFLCKMRSLAYFIKYVHRLVEVNRNICSNYAPQKKGKEIMLCRICKVFMCKPCFAHFPFILRHNQNFPIDLSLLLLPAFLVNEFVSYITYTYEVCSGFFLPF